MKLPPSLEQVLQSSHQWKVSHTHRLTLRFQTQTHGVSWNNATEPIELRDTEADSLRPLLVLYVPTDLAELTMAFLPHLVEILWTCEVAPHGQPLRTAAFMRGESEPVLISKTNKIHFGRNRVSVSHIYELSRKSRQIWRWETQVKRWNGWFAGPSFLFRIQV
jgi:hypothetical protein